MNRLTHYQVSAPAIPNLSRTVSLQYNALGMMLSKSDVGDYSYGAQGNGAVRPHALQGMAGAVSGSYTYDANGNVTGSGGGKYSAIAYTSFNLPDSQSGIAGSSNGGTRYTWQYDESHARIKEVRTLNGGTFAGTRTTWNLHPDNQGGLGFESETNTPSSPNGYNVNATSNRHYLSVGGQVIGVMVTSGALPALAGGQMAPPTLASVTVVELEYWHKDQLGSLITTTDHLGNVTQRYAYDPFGKRRYTNGSYDSFGNVAVSWSAGVNYGTERGFTGHQELDEVGLVHMNGRIFDANLGVFLQGDPLIQNPGNLQNYNRYGYCYSNPMTCTDPSGNFSLFDVVKWIDPAGYAVHAQLAKSSIGRGFLQYEITVGSYSCFAYYYACYGGGQAMYAHLTGSSDGQALRAGFVAGATAYAKYYVGTNYTGFWDNVAAHAVVGCASAAAGNGSCRSGAIGAATGAAWDMSGYQSSNAVIGLVQSSALGGIVSLVSGGTFADGSRQAAYSYLFNCLAHECLSKKWDTDADGYHSYSLDSPTLCNTAEFGCLQAARMELLCNSAPGQGQCASVGVTLEQNLTGGNKITQYAMTTDIVINGTSPGHIFDDGYVMRSLVIDSNNNVFIRTFGEGVNLSQGPASAAFMGWLNKSMGVPLFMNIGVNNQINVRFRMNEMAGMRLQ